MRGYHPPSAGNTIAAVSYQPSAVSSREKPDCLSRSLLDARK